MGIGNRRQAVGDDQRGLALRGTFQLRLDRPLVGRVERRGGLVEDHHRRVLQQRAGDRHALLFATRQFQTALADHRRVAQRRGGDEVVDVGGAGRRFDLGLSRAGTAIADVVADRVVEQHRVLRHDADGLAQAGLGDAADVLAVDGDAPAADIVEAVQQPRQRALAGSGGTDHCHSLAGRHLEADAVQDRPGSLVAELDILEADHALGHAQLGGTRGICHLALALQQGKHPVQVGQALLDLAVQHAKEIQRDVELDQKGIDHHQVTQRQSAFDHALGGAPEHRDQAQRDDQLLAGVEQRQSGLRAHLGFAE